MFTCQFCGQGASTPEAMVEHFGTEHTERIEYLLTMENRQEALWELLNLVLGPEKSTH